jgi:hypothetical protein
MLHLCFIGGEDEDTQCSQKSLAGAADNNIMVIVNLRFTVA